MKHKLSLSAAEISVALLVLLAVGLVVFPGDIDFARSLSQYAPYVTLTLLGAGVMSLLLRQQRSMQLFFCATAVLALMVRSSTSDVTPEFDQVPEAPSFNSFKVAQFSTANLAQTAPFGLEEVMDSDADVVAVYSLTPAWNDFLCERFSADFPYFYAYADIGLQGIGLFSRTELGTVDSMHLNGVVHLEACVPDAYLNDDLHLVALQTLPPVSSQGFSEMRRHLAHLSAQLNDDVAPTVVLGDFNATPWSAEIAQFQDMTGLRDSRRNAQSTFVQGVPQFFEVPVEHIFYSEQLRCAKHTTLRSTDGYLGNGAIFQARSTEATVVAL